MFLGAGTAGAGLGLSLRRSGGGLWWNSSGHIRDSAGGRRGLSDLEGGILDTVVRCSLVKHGEDVRHLSHRP